jgi:hypothetical protein
MHVFLPADLQRLQPADVNFSNWLQLAGFRVDYGPASLHLHLHWRCLRRTYRPWRCFVHLLSAGKRVSSLDHTLRPEVTRWEPGDEGYEKLDHWFHDSPGPLDLHLGLYDPRLNVRCAIVASTLPVRDDATAVVIGADAEAGNLRFPTPPLRPCGVVLQDELELTAWSAARCEDLVWLRLKWTLRGRPRRRLRFFGHVAAEPAAAAATVAQFDQELPLDRRGPATWIEQNMVARVPASGDWWLRGGVCTEPELIRVPILRGPEPYDAAEACFYRPLDAQTA